MGTRSIINQHWWACSTQTVCIEDCLDMYEYSNIIRNIYLIWNVSENYVLITKNKISL